MQTLTLRYTKGLTGTYSSARVHGLLSEEQLRETVLWYRERNAIPSIQTPSPSRMEKKLTQLGWVNTGKGCVMAGGTLTVLNNLNKKGKSPAPPVGLEKLSHNSVRISVILGGKIIASAVCLTFTAHNSTQMLAGLKSLLVSEDYRNKNFGTYLLIQCLRWAALQGVDEVFLLALLTNTQVLRWYERLGFVQHHAYNFWEYHS